MSYYGCWKNCFHLCIRKLSRLVHFRAILKMQEHYFLLPCLNNMLGKWCCPKTFTYLFQFHCGRELDVFHNIVMVAKNLAAAIELLICFYGWPGIMQNGPHLNGCTLTVCPIWFGLHLCYLRRKIPSEIESQRQFYILLPVWQFGCFWLYHVCFVLPNITAHFLVTDLDIGNAVFVGCIWEFWRWLSYTHHAARVLGSSWWQCWF